VAAHRNVLLACFIVILSTPAISFATNENAEAKKIARLVEAQKRLPLIFYVAKGAPNACGPGCSAWIAADGIIDKGSGTRFKEFVAGLPQRDLPIFFNSTGGIAGAAAEIGATLRQYRMTVGVGRTIPEGCDSSILVRESCRQLIQSKPEHKARLIVAGSICVGLRHRNCRWLGQTDRSRRALGHPRASRYARLSSNHRASVPSDETLFLGDGCRSRHCRSEFAN
jgi:hypothetical protein